MTKIWVTKKDNSIIQIESKGHTGYAQEGHDIVCAAISSILQTAILGLSKVVGVDVKVDIRDGKESHLKATIEGDLDKATRRECDIVLETMLLGIADISAGFSKFVKLEVK